MRKPTHPLRDEWARGTTLIHLSFQVSGAGCEINDLTPDTRQLKPDTFMCAITGATVRLQLADEFSLMRSL